MSKQVDETYIEKISPFLLKFSKRHGDVYNFRCPYCGDSKLSHKRRGYFYLDKTTKNDYKFSCHNCGTNRSLRNFLKDQFPQYANEYNFESFGKDNGPPPFTKAITPKFISLSKLPFLYKISELDKTSDHYAFRQYLIKRLVPLAFFNDIYYVKNVHLLISAVNGGEVISNSYNPYIVFPIFTDNTKTEASGFICRAIGDATLRYINLVVEDNSPIFNLQNISKAKPVIATEGIFDSLMVENGVCLSGITKWKTVLPKIQINKKSIIVVVDNDFLTNKEVYKHLENIIAGGYSVYLNENFLQYKDLNEFAIAERKSPKTITEMVINNSYSGLDATIKLLKIMQGNNK